MFSSYTFSGLLVFDSNDNDTPAFAQDEVAEWLRRWTANPLGSARVGSNPILVDDFEGLSLNMKQLLDSLAVFRVTRRKNRLQKARHEYTLSSRRPYSLVQYTHFHKKHADHKSLVSQR